MLRILDVASGDFTLLIDGIGRGSANVIPELTHGEETLVSGCLHADRARADRLTRIGPLQPCLWRPALRAAMTWRGGSCGFAASRLAERLGGVVPVCDPGYLASELVGTLNLDPSIDLQAPMLDDHVFEFADATHRGQSETQMLGLHEIEPGRDYALFVTTVDGLYRYRMNDVVRVTGFSGATPTLRFVQKSEGFTSITGEKLHESQVRDAVAAECRQHGLKPVFFMALVDDECARYTVYLELAQGPPPPGIAGAIDRALGERNIEYRAKRASGRLGALKVVPVVEGTSHRFRLHCVGRGQRDAQFKSIPLTTRYACSFDFDACRPAAA
ncbi:MAG: hypothetical protein HOL02_18260 [Rhodospirillaceae bacterium]|nr:hypothetical protein [Rhodospirillaceae bacterium]MBT6512379.1 hypothetical protein [Rhodospirillaceae bacterium]MBT7612003.1 hypothetical protein [Rhodospirillaceae bacterium]MBT7646944.1 hypothetical protein [Rhodospirillaceae bacterium]